MSLKGKRRTLFLLLAVAVGVCLSGMLAGVYLSYWLDSAPAPTVILVLTVMFILAFLRRVHLTRRATG